MNRKKIHLSTDQRSFVMIYQDFLESDVLDNHYQKLVYIYLKKFADSKNQCFPSVKKLSELTKISVHKIKITLAELENKGVIAKENRIRPDGGKSSNLYTLYDYKELWNADSSKERTEIINEHEEMKLVSILQSRGYTVTKEKEPSSKPAKVIDDDPNKNYSLKENDTKEKKKSQEKKEISLNFLQKKYHVVEIVQENPEYEKEFESVLDIIHTAMNTNKAIRISGRYTKAADVKERLEKLTPELILYVIKKFREQTGEIKNPSAYLLTMLYHAQKQHNLDKMNRDRQEEKKHTEPKRSKNKFLDFEQHKYSKDEMAMIERAMLKNSEI